MFNNLSISKLTFVSLLYTLLITTLKIEPIQASSETLSSQTTCQSNNGHGNNQTTEIKLVNIYSNDGTTYILDYVVGTIDPSNPSHSALNLIDIYIDGIKVSYRDLATFQVIELLDKIKAVEDIELSGNDSTSEDCSNVDDEPDLPDNEPDEPEEDPLEVVLYSD